MKLAMIGTGYVGLVAGAGFSDFGNDVACVDINERRIDQLRSGEIPIYEPGLKELVTRNLAAGRLSFTTEMARAVASADAVFLAVGTPQNDSDGGADLSHVLGAANQIGQALTGWAVIVTKSTVPVGTADRIREAIRGVTQHDFSVASNPEFLKEGDAVNDFMKPARIVLGVEDERAAQLLRNLYAPFVRTNDRIFTMDVRSAELTKYAANAMLATRISFMNELALLAEKVGADIERVRRAVGADPRIGPKFLFPGPGFGGSCLLGRESVLIRSSGQVSLRRLDELLPPSSAPETTAVRPTDMEALALPGLGEAPKFLPVTAITRRAYEGVLCVVRTKMGRSVRCTEDHPFVVTDDAGAGQSVRLAKDLTAGDWLPLANSAPDNAVLGEQTFDLIEALPTMGIACEDVLVRLGKQAVREPASTEALRAICVTERLYDIRRNGTLRLHEAQRASLELGSAMVGTCKNGTYMPARLRASPAFWRVLGLYLAEGWVTSDIGRAGAERLRVSWAFHPRDEEHLVREVGSFWEDLGTKVSIRSGKTSRYVSVSSRLLGRFFLRVLGLGADCYSHRIPDPLWSAPQEHKLAFLSGLWEGDGSWSYVGNRRGIVWEYGTVSRPLADGVLRLLGEFGIVASWKVARLAKSTVDTHFVRVSGADQVERLLDFAPECDRELIVASIARQTKRIAPTGWRGGRTGRVRVVSVEKKPYRGHVYSLEVPGAETFVTTGSLVVHNCFPKDVRALLRTAHEAGSELQVVDAVERANERQKRVLGERVVAHFGGALGGRKVAVWGLSFKPDTDDIREAPALVLAEQLLAAGARVAAYDPAAMPNVKARLGDSVELTNGMYEAAEGADALVLVTEWHAFRRPDFARLRQLMREATLFDARNVWNPDELRAFGFKYFGIGRR